jgi:hypothetical protein
MMGAPEASGPPRGGTGGGGAERYVRGGAAVAGGAGVRPPCGGQKEEVSGGARPRGGWAPVPTRLEPARGIAASAAPPDEDPPRRGGLAPMVHAASPAIAPAAAPGAQSGGAHAHRLDARRARGAIPQTPGPQRTGGRAGQMRLQYLAIQPCLCARLHGARGPPG